MPLIAMTIVNRGEKTVTFCDSGGGDKLACDWLLAFGYGRVSVTEKLTFCVATCKHWRSVFLYILQRIRRYKTTYFKIK